MEQPQPSLRALLDALSEDERQAFRKALTEQDLEDHETARQVLDAMQASHDDAEQILAALEEQQCGAIRRLVNSVKGLGEGSG